MQRVEAAGVVVFLRKPRSGQKTTQTILHYRILAQNQVKAKRNHHSRKHAQGECPHELVVRPGVWRQQSANQSICIATQGRSTCKGCIATTRKQHPIKPWITKRDKTIWIQQSQHIFTTCLHIPFFLLSGYLASSFRHIDVCMDRTCARLCLYNMMVWCCMYFAVLLQKVCRAFCAILYLHRRMNLAIRTPKMFF